MLHICVVCRCDNGESTNKLTPKGPGVSWLLGNGDRTISTRLLGLLSGPMQGLGVEAEMAEKATSSPSDCGSS